jgi:hypothetical protein
MLCQVNYRIIIIVNTNQCDSICIYLLPLHVSVRRSASEGIISTSLGATITWFIIYTFFFACYGSVSL